MTKSVFLAAFALSPLAVGILAASDARADVPVVTVCQALRGAAQYSGRIVIVVGRFVDGAEDKWLDEGCGLVLTLGDHKFPAAIATDYDSSETAPPPAFPKGFKWDKHAIGSAHEEVESTTHLIPKTSWCAIYGRLEVNPVREIDLGNGRKAETVGYGHGGGAAAQLVGPPEGVLRLKGK